MIHSRRAGPRLRDVGDVAAKHLCTGCGACAYSAPGRIEMTDVRAEGRRPLVLHVEGAPAAARAALSLCPGAGLDHGPDAGLEGAIAELGAGWGPVLEVWEGWASDPEIRFRGSSGGAATALSLFCLEREGMHGVLHTRARADMPYLNETVLSRDRAGLLAGSGSRYAPASPCDRLDLVEHSPGPCVFIGKPCDVAATRMARATRPVLDAQLGLTIAVFCAGTPSTGATLAMAASLGVDDPAEITEVRYRGRGWPGRAGVSGRQAPVAPDQLTYEQSWGDLLQKHRQWRCYICPDHTGEFADIAVGDPWHTPPQPGDPGRSLVVVRTERGRALLHRALAAGALTLERVEPGLLPASQPQLLQARGAVWGRVTAMRLTGLAVPRYRRLPTFRFWWSDLSLRQKAQSLGGTVRRIHRKRLWSRSPAQRDSQES